MGGRERGRKWEGGEGGGVRNLNLKSAHAVRGGALSHSEGVVSGTV